MTNLLEMYKCDICGNLVEIVESGEEELVCCGQPMRKLKEHTKDNEMYTEKHVPLVTKTETGYNIKIGSQPHPMENEHYIVFIEANSPDKKYVKRKYLHPGEKPELDLKCNCNEIIVRAYCNIHGLWTSD